MVLNPSSLPAPVLLCLIGNVRGKWPIMRGDSRNNSSRVAGARKEFRNSQEPGVHKEFRNNNSSRVAGARKEFRNSRNRLTPGGGKTHHRHKRVPGEANLLGMRRHHPRQETPGGNHNLCRHSLNSRANRHGAHRVQHLLHHSQRLPLMVEVNHGDQRLSLQTLGPHLRHNNHSQRNKVAGPSHSSSSPLALSLQVAMLLRPPGSSKALPLGEALARLGQHKSQRPSTVAAKET